MANWSSARTCFPACTPLARPSGHSELCGSKTCYRKVPNVVANCPLRRGVLVVRASSSAGAVDEPEKDNLATEFMRFVNSAETSWPLEGRRPTALMPPNTVVKVQMDALMRNDWPEEDSGVRTAFQFSMPPKVEEMLGGQVPKSVSAARAWAAAEKYLTFEEFSVALRDTLYKSLIDCLDWKVASPVIFHGKDNFRALQCVEIKFQTSDGKEGSSRYTFCMQKVQQGAYRNCWMVVGVRLGDYANV